MILVKDRTGSKSGTTDSTLVGVFDSKRPLYRLVKWLILHIFPPVFRLLYGFRWSAGYRRKRWRTAVSVSAIMFTSWTA